MSWKTPITMLVLLVVLLGAAYYGWKTIISPATDDKDDPVAEQPRCDETQEFTKGQIIKAPDIIVNVYNAGSRSGLATETLDFLDGRGFESGVSDNAPSNVEATNVTIVTAAKNSPPVMLVAQQFKGKVVFAKGKDLAPGIDVIVGDDFEGINQAAKKTLRVNRDVTTCTDVQSAAS